MANWTNQDFELRAKEAVGAFQAGEGKGGSSLTELVTKTARDENLTPEQVSRFSKRVNVLCFETKFAAKQGDKNVEFELVDPASVVNQLFKEASLKTAETHDLYPDLPGPQAEELPAEIKIASAEGHAERTAKMLGNSAPIDVQYNRACKLTETLEGRAKQANAAWWTAIEPVLTIAKRLRWDHDRFEKSALCLLGGDAVEELETVRESLGMCKLDLPTEKVASLVDRLDAAPTPEALRIKTAAAARAECMKYAAAATEAARVRDALKIKLNEALKHA